jgi:hypothetical protein
MHVPPLHVSPGPILPLALRAEIEHFGVRDRLQVGLQQGLGETLLIADMSMKVRKHLTLVRHVSTRKDIFRRFRRNIEDRKKDE